MKDTLKTIRDLSEEARLLFAQILTSGDLASLCLFDGCDGWEELVAKNLVNCWCDDAGNQYCEVGEQL